MPQTPDDILQQYDESIVNAKAAYQNASERLNALQAQYDALPVITDASGAEAAQAALLQKQLAEIQKTYNDAQQQYVTVLRERADAVSKAKDAADPAKRAQLDAQARADTARADQIDAQLREFLSPEASTERRQSAAAETRLKSAQANQADLELALAKEIDPLKKQQLQTQIDQAKASIAQLNKVDITTTAPKINDPNHPGQLIDNPNYRPPAATVDTTAEYISDPEKPSSFIKNPNYKSPAERLTPGQQAVDTATGTTAGATAEATLKKAQADADTALLAVEDAKRKARQSPTDAQAQQAIATAQKGLDLANQTLEQQIAQSTNLNPIAVEQARTTLVRTKQSIEQAQLGDLYGRHEQIQQIKSLVQSGDIKPEEADQMVAALNSGTTVYQARQQAQADRSSARTQDASNLNSLAGNFTSAFTSGFNTLALMNNYAPKGSTAGADAFLSLLNIAQDRLKSYDLPPAQTTDYLGGQTSPSSPVGAMVGVAQQQLGQSQPQPQPPITRPQDAPMPFTGSPSAPQPMPAGLGGPPAAQTMPYGATGAHQVTINIGGAPQQPQVSSGTEGQGNPWAGGNTPTPGTTWQNPAMGGGGLISAAAQHVPATEDDILAAYRVNKPQTAVM